MFPFGSFVSFMPSLGSPDGLQKFDSRALPGIMLGYVFDYGDHWTGRYNVVSVEDLRAYRLGKVPRPKIHDTREVFIAEFGSVPEFPAYVKQELPGKRRPTGSTGGLPPKGDQSARAHDEPDPDEGVLPDPVDPFPAPPPSAPRPLPPRAPAPGRPGSSSDDDPWPDERGKPELIDGQAIRPRKGTLRPPKIHPDIWYHLPEHTRKEWTE